MTLNHHSTARRAIRAMLMCAVAAILAACGLASEPPIVSTQPIPTITPTVPPDIGRPTTRVNLADGAEIFNRQQGCWQCHGRTGLGDGPVASSITCALPNLADADANRARSLRVWFAITTNGNGGSADCPMPGWRNSLTEQQRWDVVSYAYSLQYTPAQLMQGKELWMAQCAACHGEQAAADGPDAAKLANTSNPAPNISDLAFLLDKSDTYLANTLIDGHGGAAVAADSTLATMTSFGRLTDEQRYAVVAHMRALTWENVDLIARSTSGAPTQAATRQATQAAVAPDTPLTISGKLISGTAGENIAAGQTVTLNILEPTANGPRMISRLEAPSAADGSFTFAHVERREGAVYVTEVTYAGLSQFSTPVQVSATTPPVLDISLTVYDSTTDPTVIRLEPMRLFFDLASDGTLQVQQAMGIRNTSDRIFSNSTVARDGQGGVIISLPRDARQIAISPELERQFTINTAADGTPVAIGHLAVLPGDPALFQVSYRLPPLTDEMQFTAPTQYAVEGLKVNVPQGKLRLLDTNFTPDEPVTLQDGVFETYEYQGSISAGGAVTFRLGLVGGAGVNSSVITTALALFIAMILLGGTVLAIIRLNRRDTVAPTLSQSDALIQEIAALDDRFERGFLTPDDYHREREQLKAELMKMLDKGQESG